MNHADPGRSRLRGAAGVRAGCSQPLARLVAVIKFTGQVLTTNQDPDRARDAPLIDGTDEVRPSRGACHAGAAAKEATRQLPRLLTILLIAAALGACGGEGAAPDSTPDTATTAASRTPGGEQGAMPQRLVLQTRTDGGRVPPDLRFTTLPDFTLYADGRLVQPGVQTAVYPGPALPSLFVGSLSEQDVDAAVAAAKEAGLTEDPDAGRPMVTDRATTIFVLVAEGRTYRAAAYALGSDNARHPPSRAQHRPAQGRARHHEPATAERLAWASIVSGESKPAGLTDEQKEQAVSRLRDATSTLDVRLSGAYQWLLVPRQAAPTGDVAWDEHKLDGQGGVPVRVSRKLAQVEALCTAYPPVLLRLHLDGALAPLWKDGAVTVGRLWDAYSRYLYLHRLKNVDVLFACVAAGPSDTIWTTEGFAVAESVDPRDPTRFIGLVTSGLAPAVRSTTLVVKPDLAIAQQEVERQGQAERDRAAKGEDGSGDTEKPGGSGRETPVPPDPGPKVKRRFYGIVIVEPSRLSRDAAKVAQEVVAHLDGLVGTDLQVTIETSATIRRLPRPHHEDRRGECRRPALQSEEVRAKLTPGFRAPQSSSSSGSSSGSTPSSGTAMSGLPMTSATRSSSARFR